MAAGEECDDIESWEEMEDSGVLEKKIDKLKAAMSSSTQKEFRGGVNSKPDTVVIIAEDGRTRYLAPEPTVKILKRPSMVNSTHNAGGDGFVVNGEIGGKPKQPIKTLQQRELEYAEARLRILGEAQSPEERPALLERIRRIQNKTEICNEGVPVSPNSVVMDNQCCAVIGSTAPAPPTSHALITTPTVATNHIQQPPPPPSLMQQQTQPPSQQVIIITSTSAGHVGPPPAMVCGNSMIGQYNMVANAHAQSVFDNGYCNKMTAPYVTAFNLQSPPMKCGAGLVSHQQHLHSGYNTTGYTSALQPVAPIYNSAPTGAYMNHHQQHHIHHHHHQQHQSIVAQTGGSNNNNSYVGIHTPFSLNLAIRQPRGPDGTKGFNTYRNMLR